MPENALVFTKGVRSAFASRKKNRTADRMHADVHWARKSVNEYHLNYRTSTSGVNKGTFVTLLAYCKQSIMNL
jgi:hypothetical protein